MGKKWIAQDFAIMIDDSMVEIRATDRYKPSFFIGQSDLRLTVADMRDIAEFLTTTADFIEADKNLKGE